MKIGIDIRMLGNRHGGIGRYTFEVVKNILEIDKQNEYFLFYNQDVREDAELLGKIRPIKLIAANVRHYSVAEQIRLPKILSKYNLDLVHFPNFNVPLAYKRPFVVTIHDVVHHKIGGAKKSHLVHFYAYKKVIDYAVKNSRAIITVSEYSKKEISTYFAIRPQKITCIYEGTSLSTNVDEQEVEKTKKSTFYTSPTSCL